MGKYTDEQLHALSDGYDEAKASGDTAAMEKIRTAIQADQFGTREDGSAKGAGFLGVLQRPDGKVSSELSIGVNLDGKEVEIPTLVPTLSKDEVNFMLTNPPDPKKIPQSIKDKAVAFAKQRIAAGKSPFAGPGEGPAAAPAAPVAPDTGGQDEGQDAASMAAKAKAASAMIAAVPEAAKQAWAGAKQLGAHVVDFYHEIMGQEQARKPDTRDAQGNLVRGEVIPRRAADVTSKELYRQTFDMAKDAEAGIDIPSRDMAVTGAQLGLGTVAPESALLGRATTMVGGMMRNSAVSAVQGLTTFSPDDRQGRNALVGAGLAPVVGIVGSGGPATLNSIGRGMVAAVNDKRLRPIVDSAMSAFPKFKPTLAQITGIPGLAALERQAYNSKMIDAYANQDEQIVGDFKGLIDAKAPQGVSLDNAFTSLQRQADHNLKRLAANSNETWDNGMAEAARMERSLAAVERPTTSRGAQVMQPASENAPYAGPIYKDQATVVGTAAIPVPTLKAQFSRVFDEAGNRTIGPSGHNNQQLRQMAQILKQPTISASDLNDLLRGFTNMQGGRGRVVADGYKLRAAIEQDLQTLSQQGGSQQNAVVKQILETRAEYARQRAEIETLSNSMGYKMLGVPDNIKDMSSTDLLNNFKAFAPDKRTEVRSFLSDHSPALLATLRQEALDTAVRRAGQLRAGRDSQVDVEKLTTELFDANEGYALRTSGLWDAADEAKLKSVGDAMRVIAGNRPTTRSAGTPLDPIGASMSLASMSSPFLMRAFSRSLMGSEGYKMFTDPELLRILMVTNRSTTGSVTNLTGRAALLHYFYNHGGAPKQDAQQQPGQ